MNLLFSFLLGFPYQEELITSDESKENINRPISQKSKKGNMAAIEREEKIKALKMADKNYITPMISLKKSYKLQYNLPSSEDKKKVIQIVYYGTCAELTFQGVSTMIKCNILEDVAFLAFTVMHQINTKEMNAPKNIQSQCIQFDFTVIKSDSKKSKAANKLFYYFSTEGNNFGYLIETPDGDIPEKVEQMAQKCGKTDYIFSSPCKFHWKNLNIMITKASDEIKLRRVQNKMKRCAALLANTNQEEPSKATPTTMGSRTNKSGKSAKSEKNPPDMTLAVSGEKLIYEKAVWTTESYSELLIEDLMYTGSLMTNTGIYTDKQRSHFKSLSFYIKSIQNIPPSIKEKHKVDQIYLEYSLEPVFQIEKCNPIELQDQNNLKIKEVRTFFNDGIPADKLIETIQNNLLVVKIYGRRAKNSEVETPRVWGQDLSCTQFARRFHQFIDQSEIEKQNEEQEKKDVKKPASSKSKASSKKSKKAPSMAASQLFDDLNTESVVLGYSTISLYELMKYTFIVSANAPINSTFLTPSNKVSTTLRPMNVMHFHRDFRPPQKGLVEQRDYTDHNTILKVEIKLGYDLAKNVLPEVLTFPTLFTVCVIIDYDTRSSYNLLKEILEHNKAILKDGKNLPNIMFQNLGISPLYKIEKKPLEELNEEGRISFSEETNAGVNDQNYFTGFMVDCIDFSITMIESLEIQAISKIMVHRYQMMTEEGRLLYNSNLVFTERIYDDFVKFGGMFLSALGLPLDATLGHKSVQEYIPAPALRCLRTLKTISRTKNIRRSILPTPLELLSMDAEFGVPLHKAETFVK